MGKPLEPTEPLAPSARTDLTQEYVAGGTFTWYSNLVRALPPAIDDLTGDFGDDLYDRMLFDPQIAACMMIMKAAILEDGLHLTPAVDDADDAQYATSKQILEEAEPMIEDMTDSLEDVLWDMLGAIAKGNRVAEIKWQDADGFKVSKPLINVATLKVKPRRATAFVVDPYLNLVGVLGRPPGFPSPFLSSWLLDPKAPPPNLIPRSRFSIVSYRPEDGDPRGTALDPETQIPTPDGWRRMDDLQPGDKVFDEEGRIRYVTARKDWDDRPCYELTFRGGETIVADVNHQWVTQLSWERYQKRPGQVRTTAEIVATLRNKHYSGGREKSREVGLANHSIPWAKPLDYPEQMLPVHPYYLGLWLGDGTGSSANISCHERDLDETVALIGAAGYSATTSRNGTSEHGRLIRVGGSARWDSTGPSHALRLLGVQRDDNNVDCKHIPEAYLRGSIQQRRDLLAGLMDADGSVDSDGRCEFSNTNRNLAEGVLELARSLGVPAGIRLHHAAHVGADGHARKDAWGVFFTPPWSPFKLSRKAAKTISARAMRQHYIVDAQPVTNRRTICIETDGPSHLYLAGRAMIPTHNSLLRAAYEPWWRKRQIYPEMLKYLATFAGPSLWGATAENALPQVQLDADGVPIPGTRPLSPETVLANALQAIRNGTALAVPFGTEINAVPVQAARARDPFNSALVVANLEITKCILTQNLATEEGEHQARAAASVHEDVLDTLVRQGKHMMIRAIRKDVLQQWVIYNWGEKARHLVPRASLGVTEERDRSTLITAMAGLVNAKLSDGSSYVVGSQLQEIDTMLGLPVRSADELPPTQEELRQQQQEQAQQAAQIAAEAKAKAAPVAPNGQPGQGQPASKPAGIPPPPAGGAGAGAAGGTGAKAPTPATPKPAQPKRPAKDSGT